MNIPTNATAFRLYLKDQLALRQGRNPRYSLRSFARFLEVDSSALSKMMNGKRALGPKMMQRMFLKLSSTYEERQQKEGPQNEGPQVIQICENSFREGEFSSR